MKKIYGGFVAVPTLLLDQYLAELSGSEIKVLLYVLRRTVGFQRESAPISLNQFMHGIALKESGTGLSKPAVKAAIKSLVAGEYIERTQETSIAGDLDTSIYRVGRKLTHQGNDTAHGRSKDLPSPVQQINREVGNNFSHHDRYKEKETRYIEERLQFLKQETPAYQEICKRVKMPDFIHPGMKRYDFWMERGVIEILKSEFADISKDGTLLDLDLATLLEGKRPGG